jgi:hypothetical protein
MYYFWFILNSNINVHVLPHAVYDLSICSVDPLAIATTSGTVVGATVEAIEYRGPSAAESGE